MTDPRSPARPDWTDLRAEERVAAWAGYAVWDAFVEKCERLLGLPWAEIVARFERMP